MKTLIKILVLFVILSVTSAIASAHENDPEIPDPQGISGEVTILVDQSMGGCNPQEFGNIIYFSNNAPAEKWLDAKHIYRLSEMIRNVSTPKQDYWWLPLRIAVRFEKNEGKGYGGWFSVASWDAEACTLGWGEHEDGDEWVRVVTIVNYDGGDDFEVVTSGHELAHAWGSPHGASSPAWINADRSALNVNDAYWWSTESGHWWAWDDSPLTRAFRGSCRDMREGVDAAIVHDPWCHLLFKAIENGEIWIADGDEGRLVQTIP